MCSIYSAYLTLRSPLVIGATNKTSHEKQLVIVTDAINTPDAIFKILLQIINAPQYRDNLDIEELVQVWRQLLKIKLYKTQSQKKIINFLGPFNFIRNLE